MDETKYAKLCSRFDVCSVNVCPLDPLHPLRPEHPRDPKKKCQEHLRHRIEIVARARSEGVSLQGGGLTRAEIATGLPVEVLLDEWDARKERQRAQAARLRGPRNPS